MKEFLMWTGMVFGILASVLMILIGISILHEKWENRRKKTKETRDTKAYKKLSFTVAVRIPSKTQFFTPIAYVYGRNGRPPVVTIFNQTFFKKLPDITPIFVIEADNKYRTEIETIGGLRTALRLYNTDIKKSWEI